MEARQVEPRASGPLTLIQRAGPGLGAELGELWRFRELLAFLAWRDLRVRYRQTLLGFGWALIEPFVSVVLFTLLFNRMAGIDAGDLPYPLFCFTAMLLWTFFARAVRAGTISLVANAPLITKAYFPRLVLPLAGQLATVVDFGCALVMYFVLAGWYGYPPGPHVLTLPVWLLLAGVVAAGVGLLLAAVNVRFRDVSQALPFLTQVWMFATPVAYPLGQVPSAWRALYALNPMVGIVEGMRWALLPGYALDAWLVAPSVTLGPLLLLVGLAWFRQTQRRFADIV